MVAAYFVCHSAQIFRYLWFMPSLGVRSPCSRSKIQFRVQYEFLFWEPLTSFGDNFEAEMACLWPYLFRHSCHSSSPKASLRTLLERQGYMRKTGVHPESLLCCYPKIANHCRVRWCFISVITYYLLLIWTINRNKLAWKCTRDLGERVSAGGHHATRIRPRSLEPSSLGAAGGW